MATAPAGRHLGGLLVELRFGSGWASSSWTGIGGGSGWASSVRAGIGGGPGWASSVRVGIGGGPVWPSSLRTGIGGGGILRQPEVDHKATVCGDVLHHVAIASGWYQRLENHSTAGTRFGPDTEQRSPELDMPAKDLETFCFFKNSKKKKNVFEKFFSDIFYEYE